MDSGTRNAIGRAVQLARETPGDGFASQREGTFDELTKLLAGDYASILEDFRWDTSADFAHLVYSYDLAPALGLGELGDFANVRSSEAEASGTWEGNAIELWLCLFFEHRRYRHFGFGPTGEALARLDALCRTMRERLLAESGRE